MSSVGVPLDYASTVSTALEGILYGYCLSLSAGTYPSSNFWIYSGFSVCLFGATCFNLIGLRTPSGRTNYIMLTTASLLFIFSTIVSDLIHVL